MSLALYPLFIIAGVFKFHCCPLAMGDCNEGFPRYSYKYSRLFISTHLTELWCSYISISRGQGYGQKAAKTVCLGRELLEYLDDTTEQRGDQILSGHTDKCQVVGVEPSQSLTTLGKFSYLGVSLKDSLAVVST